MPEYLVTWQLPLAADSAQDAANLAHGVMQDPGNIATGFRVERLDPPGSWFFDVGLLGHEQLVPSMSDPPELPDDAENRCST